MTQAPAQQEISWWLVLCSAVIFAVALPLIFWSVNRKRSWRDWKRLGRAATLPPEHFPPEPRRLRDMVVGEKGYVDSYNIATSKKGRRVFVSWDATLKDTPRDLDDRFAALEIRRLRRGFSLVIRAGDQFGARPIIWGEYAPVIELVQRNPQEVQSPSPRPQ